METVKDVGEFGCIREIAHDLIYRPELVKLGAGDDAAVYVTPPGYDQLISTDTMVEGIHFTKETMAAADVGYHLCAANFSDMAAMGAEPTVFVISVAIPDDLPVQWLEDCYDGIRECCKKYKVNLLGGDITGSRQGVVMTGTVVGMVPTNRAVKRSGAQPGDIVFVTGTLGDSAAGLTALLNNKEKDFPTLARRHQRPEPRIGWGNLIREAGASSLNDISDGLSREINEIASASKVKIELDGSLIPLSEETIRLGQEMKKDPLFYALHGGEDYELVGTISESGWEQLKDHAGLTRIGHVLEKNTGRVFIKKGNHIELLEAMGYDHFRS